MNKVIIGFLLAIVAAGAIFFASQNTSVNKTLGSSYENLTNSIAFSQNVVQ